MWNFGISWLYQFIIILIAWTSFGIGTPISAGAFALLGAPVDVFVYSIVFDNIFCRVTPFTTKEECIVRWVAIFYEILPVKVMNYLRLTFAEIIEAIDRVGCVIYNIIKGIFKHDLIKKFFLFIIKLMILHINTKVLLLIIKVNLNALFKYFLNLHLDELAINLLPLPTIFVEMHFCIDILNNLSNLFFYFTGYIFFRWFHWFTESSL
jgi:hypothetical protein